MKIPQYDENGKMMLNENYKEILVLDKMLTEAGIPHTLRRFYDGWQVCYPNEGDGTRKSRIMDAVEHHFSYGEDEDLIEIAGLLTPVEQQFDSVLGYLSAKEVFDRIYKDYKGGRL